MVHFIMDAVKALDLSRARTNQRGSPCTLNPLSSTTDSFEATLESYLWGWASFLRWVLSR
jgi:hypothetical protein